MDSTNSKTDFERSPYLNDDANNKFIFSNTLIFLIIIGLIIILYVFFKREENFSNHKNL